MTQPPPPFDPDALLEHTRGLRATARALLSDDHQVDDVLQETWLAALRARPDARRPLGGWLRTVAGNFARMRRRAARRRRFHEQRAARSGAEPSPAEALERFEMQRLVARSVAELEEPYRTTIVLRYFEDLSPTEIARRTGEPPGTVRSRIKRGRERLRERLDAAHRGDRRASLLSLAAVAGLAEESLAFAGAATALATKAMLAVAATLIVGLGIVLWLAAGDEADPELHERAAAPPPPAEQTGSGAPAATTQAEVAEREEPVPISGRILAPWGAGLADVDVYVLAPWRGHPADGPKLLGRARTGGDGAFVVPTKVTGPLAIAAKAEGYGWGHLSLRGLRRGIEMELHPARRSSGLVVDPEGDPVPGARVRFEGIPASEVLTDPHGEFVLEAHEYVHVEAWHPDFMPKRDRLAVVGSRIVLGRGDVVEGVVLSHGERRPVPGATVRVPGNFGHTATTDANGRFETRVDLRKRGALYTIWVEAGRLGTLFVPGIPWTPGHALELELRPTRVLAGRVLTADGRRPVDGAAVSIVSTGEEPTSSRWQVPTWLRTEAVSQADGSFRFEGVSTRQVQLAVRHHEYALTDGPDAEYVAPGGDIEIEALVAPRVHLTGIVVGPDGRPLADAAVRVLRAGDPSHLGPGRFRGEPRTDARGRFRMRWPPRTYYPKLYKECELAVFHRDCELARSKRFEPAPGSRHEFEIRLVASPPRPDITGRVEDPHGAPVAMAQLIAQGPARGRTYSAPDGTFRIPRLEDGVYSLQCFPHGFVPRTLEGVAAGSDLVITVQARHVFRGRLVDEDGRPVVGVRVGLQPWGLVGGYVRTSDDGSFAFDGEAPGRYRLRLARAQAVDEDALELTIPCEDVVEFVVRRPPPLAPTKRVERKLFPLEGRVLRQEGKPFPVGTLVHVQAAGEERRETWCDLEGSFSFRVPEGAYTLTVRLEGGRAIFEPVANVASGTTSLVIRPVETGSISGTLTGPGGRPVPYAGVWAVRREDASPADRPRSRGHGWPGEMANTDEQGRFTITNLVDTRYVLVAFQKGYAVKYVPDRSWRESDVRIVLEEGQRLSGRIQDPDGEPLRLDKPPVVVEVVDSTGVRRYDYPEDDTFVVRGLADGLCRVAIHVPRKAYWWEREGVPTARNDLVARMEALTPEEFRAKASR